MQLSLDSDVYDRLCELAHERNTTPAPLAALWVEAKVRQLWGDRGEPDANAVAAPTSVRPRYRGRVRKVL